MDAYNPMDVSFCKAHLGYPTENSSLSRQFTGIEVFLAQKMSFQNPTIGPSIRSLAILMPPGVMDI
jgi:hypothetical protein